MPNTTPEPLTRQEERRLRRYYVLANLSAPALMSGVLIPFVVIGLIILDEVVLGGDCPVFYPALMIVLSLSLMLLFVVCGLVIRYGTRGKCWDIIEEKLAALEAAAPPAAAIPSGKRRKKKVDQLEQAARRWGIRIPHTKLWNSMVFMVPLLIILLAFAPELMHSYRDSQQTFALVTQTTEQVAQAFEAAGYKVHRPATDHASTRTYRIDCSGDAETRLSILLNTQGQADQLQFYMDVQEASPEENIRLLNQFVSESFSILLGTGAPITIPQPENYVPMPEELSAPYRDARFLEETISNRQLIPMEQKQLKLSFSYYYHAPDSENPSFLCYNIEDQRYF